MKGLKIFLWYRQCVFLSAIVLLLSFIGSGCSKINKEENMIKPPAAEKIKKELTIHGDTRIDNYYWLNERENPKVIEYLKAENEYKEAVMKHTETLQEYLYNEIVARIKQTDMSVPFKTEGY
ncbi:MAG: oligopeptidase B, partial [Acidobacteriota bacterium]|nr:oligopeptidase B [Acidobacteriota bacterium]